MIVKRRALLGGALALPFIRRARAEPRFQRVSPGQPGWPAQAEWDGLARAVEGRLAKMKPSLDVCRAAPQGKGCLDLFRELKNPYFIGDDPSLTQTMGWYNGWTASPPEYVVAARRTEDVVAAVNFAREKRLRLVVRGGGHSYLGTSSAYHSLMIWTRAMNGTVLHDAFVPQNCPGPGRPAVSVGAGAIWMHTYNAVTTGAGRYVQGGGCGTVGVAGLLQGGGFGSYSKNYGVAAASLLEAEIVTADGAVRIANACTNSDLFWALKGGGGGTFGVVTRVTLATHELPPFFGGISVVIEAVSDQAFRALIDRFFAFYRERLFNPHWGEIANIRPRRRLDLQMAFQGLTQEEAVAIWQPFLDWVKASHDYTLEGPPRIYAVSGRRRWDPGFIRKYAPSAIRQDDRPGASADNIFWSANLSETGHFIHDFESVWLPASFLGDDARDRLVDAMVAAARHSSVEVHFQKGLAGGSPEAIAASRETSMNPAVLDAFALAIVASEGPPALPGLEGHEPNLREADANAAKVRLAAVEIQALVRRSGAYGSYVAESSYFQFDWQQDYWGAHYPRLLAIKKQVDPETLFFVRHGVGCEGWSDSGFIRY